MKILSIDVGIKNIAVCVVQFNASGHRIMEWVIINLIQDLLDNQLTCCVTRRGSRCKKVASNKVIVHDTVLGFCKLKTCQKELLGSYTKRQIKKYKKINANHVGLDILGSNIYHGLMALKNLDNLDYVLIENQPVLKNPKMKSIQMIIYSFFMFMAETPKSAHKTILFNPSTKLKVYDGPTIKTTIKNKYAIRKFLSVEYTKYFLNKTQNTNWIEFFNDNSKKDDLADAYLQALTYHHKLPKS
tara:strand:+ start:149 stop:877 length:729 start_codon:yes stop_codon:yes gene_type:complete